ncbi:MAG: PDZ domain-containing protein, partial [Pseudomonadota bacterium]
DDLIAEKLGIQVLPLTPQIARQLGVDPDTAGLVIGAVDPSSDAGRKGLRRGTIILSSNYVDVGTVEDLRAQITAAEEAGRESLLLQVIPRRGIPPRFIGVRIRE